MIIKNILCFHALLTEKNILIPHNVCFVWCEKEQYISKLLIVIPRENKVFKNSFFLCTDVIVTHSIISLLREIPAETPARGLGRLGVSLFVC